MIRPLRQRHRRVVTSLFVVLPLAFVAAIIARRPVPISEASGSERARSITLTNHVTSETATPLKP